MSKEKENMTKMMGSEREQLSEQTNASTNRFEFKLSALKTLLQLTL